MSKKVLIRAFSAAMVLFASVLFSASAFAQNRTINGKVADNQGLPVIGAAVVVVGQTTTGTLTDVDGKFVLNVPAKASIEVSCIGYVSQTIAVGNRTSFEIVLAEDSQLLEETVVIGYGVQKKSDLTGSVASVRSEDLQNRSTSDAAAALQGKAAGVQILNASGAPGAGAEIRVRGFSSNSGSLGPLLIVDGLKVDNIQYLDPEMIESIEVLKDAASAAIYGAQAGNGVVLVTTKTGAGSKGDGKVFYNNQFSLASLSRSVDTMNAEEYIAFGKANGYLTQTMLDTYYDGKTDVDWGKEVFTPTWSQRHTVGFQGGNERGNYFASLNYVDNDGIFRGDKDTYNRLTFQVNADYRIKKWLTVGTNNSIEKWSTKSISQRSDNGSAMLAVLTSSPLFPVACDYDGLTPAMKQALADGTKVLEAPEYPGKYWALPLIGETQSANPFIQRDASDSTSGGFSIRGVAYANLTPFKGFTFTSRFGYRIAQSTSHYYIEPYYANAFVKNDTYSISATANTSYYYQWENFANYNRTFGKHDISAMAGMSYTENNYDNVYAAASGTDVLKGYAENFRYLDYVKSGDGITKSMTNAPGRSAQLSYFARLGYSYDNRYSVQANFRADAFDSSKLPANSRWGYFPSVSAGWTLSNEGFIKDNISRETLSFLKFRASWGINGNINVLSGYPYSSTISVNGQWYQYGVDSASITYGSMPSGIPNENLRWETSEQIDLGLDARMFNDRLSVGIDYYKKDTRDLLVGVSPVYEVGVSSSTTTNAGSIRNSGLELELSWKDQIGDFSYSISGNMSTLKNQVTYLDPSLDRIVGTSPQGTKMSTIFEEGYPIWYMLGYKATGIDSEGNATYQDTNNDGKIDDNDRVNIGCGIPDVTYGITVNLAYKNFDLTIFGTGAAGNEILPTSFRTDRPSCNTYSYYWNNSWKEGQDNSNAKFPAASKWTQEAFSSTLTVFDGSYFKIKQIQLGYTLPRTLLRKVNVSNCRVFVSLDNFFTFTKYIGLDPEIATYGGSSSGIDMGVYPTSKQLIFGVNLAF